MAPPRYKVTLNPAPSAPTKSTLTPQQRKVFATVAKTAAAEGATPQTYAALHKKIIDSGGTEQDALNLISHGRSQVKIEKVAAAGVQGGYLKKQIQNIGRDVAGMPGGVIHAVAAPGFDVARGDLTFPRTRSIAKQTGVGTYQSIRHPGRDVFGTALTAGAFASAGAGAVGRVAGVGKAVGEGAGARAITRAAIVRPPIKERTLYVPGEKPGQVHVVHPLGSKNLIVNATQRRVIDTARNKRLARSNLVQGGHALTLPPEIATADQAPAVASAMHAISSVHSSKPIPARVAVMAEKRIEGALGVRTGVHDPNFPGGVRPVAVEFDPTKHGVQATVTHEMGHVMQDTVRGQDAHVLAAITKTDVYKNLHQELASGTHKAFAKYGADPKELFARAYTQYIGEQSGNAAITEGIRKFDQNLLAQGYSHDFHWTPKDFAPVKQAFDEMFQKLGYRTKGGAPVLPMRETTAHRVFGAQAQVGREMRAARKVSDQKQLAQVSALEHYGVTRPARVLTGLSRGRFEKPAITAHGRGQRLTQAEQKAADVVSSGKTAISHQVYEQGRIAELKKELEQISQTPREGPGSMSIITRARAVRSINKEIFRHQGQLALAKLAGSELKNPRPNLLKAIDESRNAIQQRERLLGISPEQAAHRVGARAAEIKSAGRNSPIVRLGLLEKQLSRLKHRDQHDPTVIQAQEGIKQEITRIHEDFVKQGFSAIDQGAFYVPSKSQFALRGAGSAFVRHKVPGALGLGPPRTLPELSHAYTGALQRTGNARTDVTGLASESYRRAQAYASLDRAHRQLLSISFASKEAAGPSPIPIRTSWNIPQDLKTALLKTDQGSLTTADIEKIDPRQVQDAAKALFPSEADLNGDFSGVRWLDSRYITGAKGTADYGGSLGKTFDVLNAPFRAALLYTKPAYALNLLQALGTNVVQQGVFTPANMYHALTLGRKVGAEDQRIIFAINGQGLSRSYEAGQGLGSRAIDAAGETWNVVVDRYPRVASWLHEARTAGFKSPQQIHQLLHNRQFESKLVEVTRRANNEAIPYGDLTPFERNVLKRGLFFYPWMRGSTIWSLRFPMEHPIQAAAYYQLGQQGANRADRIIGKRPFYDKGLIPLGNTGLTTDLTNLSNPSTPAEAVGGLMALSQGRTGVESNWLRQQLGPIAGAGTTLLTGTTSLGHQIPQSESRLGAAAKELTGLVPGYTAYQRATTAPSTETNPSKRPIEPTGPLAAAERFAAGRVFPVHRDIGALNAKGEAEYVAGLPKDQRISYKAGKEIEKAQGDAQFLHSKGVLTSPGLPQNVRDSIDVQRRYQIAELKAKAATSLDRLKADTQVAVEMGRMTAADRQALLGFIAQAPASRQKTVLGQVRAQALNQAVLKNWNSLVNRARAGG